MTLRSYVKIDLHVYLQAAIIKNIENRVPAINRAYLYWYKKRRISPAPCHPLQQKDSNPKLTVAEQRRTQSLPKGAINRELNKLDESRWQKYRKNIESWHRHTRVRSLLLRTYTQPPAHLERSGSCGSNGQDKKDIEPPPAVLSLFLSLSLRALGLEKERRAAAAAAGSTALTLDRVIRI